MAMKHVALVGALVSCLSAPPTASADILAITPELLAKFTDLAKAARSKHPTDPAAASDAFNAEVGPTFGDLSPISLEVDAGKDISIRFLTPVLGLATAFRVALLQLEPFPTKAPFEEVVLYITPKTMLAPSVTKVVVFHGDDQVEPTSSALEAKEYSNRLGAKTTIAVGHLTFPAKIFDGTKPVKVLCFSNAGMFKQWSITAEWAKEVK